MRIYCDGKKAEGIGGLVICISDDYNLFEARFYRGNLTQNKIEYLAILLACEVAPPNSMIFSDSMIVVNQLRGEFKVRRDDFKEIWTKIKKLMYDKNLYVSWVRREENLAGLILG